MWIEDLAKAFWMLNALNIKWQCCVWKVENGYIYMTQHGLRFEIAELVKQYNKEYGVSEN